MKNLLCSLGCVFALPILSQITCFGAENPARDLTVEVGMAQTNYLYPADLVVTVALQNHQTRTVEFYGSQWNETFPFRFRIWKEGGGLLNPPSGYMPSHGREPLPDQKSALAKRKIVLQAAERREYKFVIKDFTDENEARHLIPVGRYLDPA